MLSTFEPYFVVEPIIKAIVPKQLRPTVRTMYRKQLYKGNNVECPCCGGHFKRFLPFGYKKKRLNAQCPDCNALERHRLLWLYLKRETSLLTDGQPIKVLHVAPEESFEKAFRKLPSVDYLSIDLDSPRAMKKMDLTNLPLEDNSFDLILCVHVLEHIPEARKAMDEMYRVLKPGGTGIILVPVDKDRTETLEDPSIVTPEDRTRHFGQWDHVRQYGLDYADKLAEAGFQVQVVENYAQQLGPDSIRRFSIADSEDLYISRKA